MRCRPPVHACLQLVEGPSTSAATCRQVRPPAAPCLCPKQPHVRGFDDEWFFWDGQPGETASLLSTGGGARLDATLGAGGLKGSATFIRAIEFQQEGANVVAAVYEQGGQWRMTGGWRRGWRGDEAVGRCGHTFAALCCPCSQNALLAVALTRVLKLKRSDASLATPPCRSVGQWPADGGGRLSHPARWHRRRGKPGRALAADRNAPATLGCCPASVPCCALHHKQEAVPYMADGNTLPRSAADGSQVPRQWSAHRHHHRAHAAG